VIHTAHQARQWVEAATVGVTYTEGGMDALLGRLGIHPKVPRPVNPKADLAFLGLVPVCVCRSLEPRVRILRRGLTNHVLEW
jgi:hypothetical protein